MRDAQGQSYWQWCREEHFTPHSPAVEWDASRNALALSSQSFVGPPKSVPRTASHAAAEPPALAVDAYGTWARVRPESESSSGGGDAILAGGVTTPDAVIFETPAGTVIHDIVPTLQGWLLIAMSGSGGALLVIHDLLDRFADVSLSEPGFAPDRIAVSDDGTIWVLDREHRRLRQVRGTPLPQRVSRRRRADHVFQAETPNSDPPRLHEPPQGDLQVSEEFIDAVALDDGRLIILGLGQGRESLLRLTDGTDLSAAVEIFTVANGSRRSLRSGFSMGRFGERLALLVPGADIAFAVPVPEEQDAAVDVLGLILPLRRGVGARFCNGVAGGRLAYRTTLPSNADDRPAMPFAHLVAPSHPTYAKSGDAAALIVEADGAQTQWHRLYLEANLPPDCGVNVLLAADDDLVALQALALDEMQPHRFGATDGVDGPQGVWLDFDSEKPFVASATGEARKENRCGLYTALAQRSDQTVKRITGRYLRIELQMHGSGLATPRLYALRIWGPRAAWRERYLPDFLSLDEGPHAAGSDFLDRYLAIFESLLTPLEDQVAMSWRLTRPDTTPADALDWLASWIGAEFDSALTESARRHLLADAVGLWRRRGTLPGLRKMLDIVTEGGITRGELVVLEHFHLRRTFSTILGADLSDAENPLTPYAKASGNSHLGATFFLGAEDEKAFFALFRPQLLDDALTTTEERQAALDELGDFFDQHAHRVTLLIHSDMASEQRDLIARVLRREVPAHVQSNMLQGPGSLVLALSSLVAVDTHLAVPPPRQELRLGDAKINQVFLSDVPALDPRFEGGA